MRGMRQRRVCSLLADVLAAEGGQDVVEYGLLIALIAVIVLVGVSAFGSQIEPWFVVLAARVTTTGT